MTTEQKIELDYIYSIFEKEEKILSEKLNKTELPEDKSDLISKLGLIRFSKELLRRCLEYNILPKSIWRKVPEPQNIHSEFRLLEDLESENRIIWKEVEYFRLNGGEVVIG